MNVIFIDIDGTLNGLHYIDEKHRRNDFESINVEEDKLVTLKHICDRTNSSVVLSSTWKMSWGEEEEPQNKYLKELLELFKKYGIPFYGKTPTIEKRINEYKYISTWKEYEIKAYLDSHPEIEHFCIIDDYLDDLESFRDYVVKTEEYTKDGENEGLMPYHEEEAVRIMKRKYR